MTVTSSLPQPIKMPLWRRRIKFLMQPVEYVEDFAKIYGDPFTISGSGDQRLIYFSQPEALEQIFTADASHFEVGRGNRALRFLLGDACGEHS